MWAYLLNIEVEWVFSKKREEFTIISLWLESSGKDGRRCSTSHINFVPCLPPSLPILLLVLMVSSSQTLFKNMLLPEIDRDGRERKREILGPFFVGGGGAGIFLHNLTQALLWQCNFLLLRLVVSRVILIMDDTKKKKNAVFLPCGIDHCYEMNPWINSVGHLQGAFRISLVGSGNSEEAIHCLCLVPLILKDHAPVYNINHLIDHYWNFTIPGII